MIKTEYLRTLLDYAYVTKSLVIPIPWTERALRIGGRLSLWCKLGPRQYRLVATPEFMAQFHRITGSAPSTLTTHGVEIPVERRE